MPTAHRLTPAEAARITGRIAALSVAVAAVLIAMKLAAWLASGSVALLSSLADSALDLAASVATFLAVRYAARPPDAEHRFGHGKAEAFAGLFQAGLVAVSALLIAVEATGRLLKPTPVEAGGWAAATMAAATVITAVLVWAQTWAARQTGSIATKGDRAHYLSDLAGNLVVLVGVAAAAWFGLPQADAAAGLLVVVWLAYGAWQVAAGAADHLMDKELPAEDRARIAALATADGAIRGVHDLRTRTSGPFVHVQFHADLDPGMTLSEAHRCVVAAEERIRAAFPAADVLIHPDPENASEPHGLQHFGERRAGAAGA